MPQTALLANFLRGWQVVITGSVSGWLFIGQELVEKFVLNPLRFLNYNYSVRHYTVIALPIMRLKLTESMRKPCLPALCDDRAEWLTDMKIKHRFITKNSVDFHLMFYDKKDAALFMMFFGGRNVD